MSVAKCEEATYDVLSKNGFITSPSQYAMSSLIFAFSRALHHLQAIHDTARENMRTD